MSLYCITPVPGGICGQLATSWDNCPKHQQTTQTVVPAVTKVIQNAYINLTQSSKTVRIFSTGQVSLFENGNYSGIFDLDVISDDIKRRRSDYQLWSDRNAYGVVRLSLLASKVIADRICEFIPVERKVQLIKDIRDFIVKGDDNAAQD